MITRRTLTTGAAWTVPAVALAATAPAYATSTPTTCTPTGEKLPGRGPKHKRRKSYRLRFDCTRTDQPQAVTIDGHPAVLHGDGWWWLTDQPDSRGTRFVTVTWADGDQWSDAVWFRPVPGEVAP